MTREATSTVILNDGREVALGWLARGDQEWLAGLTKGLDADEYAYLGVDLRDQAALAHWLAGIRQGKRKILGAWDPAHPADLAGYALLQPGRGAHRHIGQVETFLAPAARELGLGSNMIRELAAEATKDGLLFLELEVHLKQRGLINAFKNLGFELKAIIEGYRVGLEGQPYDVIIMLKRLAHVATKDFLYRY